MNAAYKWYSHNSNIIQFYSGYSDSKSVISSITDNSSEPVERAYDYSSSVVNFKSDINVN